MSNPPPVYRDIVLVHVDAKTKEKTDVPFRVFERWVPRQRLVVLAVCPHPKDVKKYPSYIAAAKHRDRAERSDADVPLDKLLEGQVCVCALFVRKNAGIPEEKRRWGYYTPFNEAADKGRKVPLPGEYHIEWVRDEYKYTFADETTEPPDVAASRGIVAGLICWFFEDELRKERCLKDTRVTLEAAAVSAARGKGALRDWYRKFGFQNQAVDAGSFQMPMATTAGEIVRKCNSTRMQKPLDRRGVARALCSSRPYIDADALESAESSDEIEIVRTSVPSASVSACASTSMARITRPAVKPTLTAAQRDHKIDSLEIAISTLLEDIDDAVDKKEPPEKVRKLREEVARHRAELSELEGD